MTNLVTKNDELKKKIDKEIFEKSISQNFSSSKLFLKKNFGCKKFYKKRIFVFFYFFRKKNIVIFRHSTRHFSSLNSSFFVIFFIDCLKDEKCVCLWLWFNSN